MSSEEHSPIFNKELARLTAPGAEKEIIRETREDYVKYLQGVREFDTVANNPAMMDGLNKLAIEQKEYNEVLNEFLAICGRLDQRTVESFLALIDNVDLMEKLEPPIIMFLGKFAEKLSDYLNRGLKSKVISPSDSIKKAGAKLNRVFGIFMEEWKELLSREIHLSNRKANIGQTRKKK